ncbi:DUF2235 domain-containing protein [Roseovarius nanhaiticus]|uniref:DUF2235 domain-containing protein n=1 Tax=Roseovarius nanhaiticus TaxID=573024 RepID=UPI00249134F2|nr:DUF2235 domain-containing protein [Roseovarius nanhaiticus]
MSEWLERPKNPKRLAIFLDGTWNEPGDNTNVWRLRSLCSPVACDGTAQFHYYDPGPSGFKGGTFGVGVSDNVVQAYEWLIDHYADGDDIFIFGFSRGAFTARSLAGFITKYGLLRPGAPLSVRQMFDRYQTANKKTIWKLNAEVDAGKCDDHEDLERWMVKYARCVNIKMVGVWDTVGALGIPRLSIPGISRSTFGWHHTGLRIPIEHGFHALAIDEHRPPFKPTLWTVRKGIKADSRPLESVEQRWFVGAHGNVGGGYISDLLGQPPLRWMAKKAQALGLELRYDVLIDGDACEAKVADSYKAFLRGAYSMFFDRHHRVIGAEPWADQSGNEHSTVNETIDHSVFQRWRSDRSYRPEGLTEWSSRKQVDLSKITSSALAIDGSPIDE